MTEVVLGVLVGGASRRMGGQPKGLLTSPESDEPILVRLLRLGRELGFATAVVGEAAPYRALCGEAALIADDPAAIGPLGGLRALLRHAASRPAVALSCDLPVLSKAVLSKLAFEPSAAAVLATRRAPNALWEPLVARYRPELVLPAVDSQLAVRQHSLQRLFARLDVAELALDQEERRTLVDWDSPEDVVL